MALTNWLVNCKNPDELKAQYYLLARKHHPDVGGDTEIMQQLNAEYGLRMKLFKAGFNVSAPADTDEPASRKSSRPEHRANPNATTEWGKLGITQDAFEAYQAVCLLRESERYPFGIVIKIMRGQVQVGGKATLFYRERLKQLGFLWNSSTRYWFYARKPFSRKSG